jgi:hypothetical protein
MNRPARLAVMLAAVVAVPAAAFAQLSDAQSADSQTSDLQSPGGRTEPDDQADSGSQSAAAQQQAAQTQVYYHVAAWDAFSGRSSQGGPVCGVESTNRVDNRNLSIRFDIGGTDTTFAATKPSWSIPDGTRAVVVMQVGLNAPWTLHGSGYGHAIGWTLDRNAIQGFDRQFRSAQSMTLTFPDGNEPPWTISLTGSTAISDTFGRCITDLTRQVQAAANSSGSAAPQGATQPFSPSAGAAPPAH